ncbi:MAG: MAG1210 family protein [Bacilli bacterium]|jgi:hypothetical protein
MGDLFTSDASFIEDPLKQFQKVFKNLHNDNTNSYIDALIEKSGVNVDLNRATVGKLNTVKNKISNLLKSISKKKVLRGFLIFLAIIGIVALIVAIVISNDEEVKKAVPFLVGGGGVLATIGSVLLIIFKVRPDILKLLGAKGALDEQAASLQAEALQQMKALNDLFADGMQKELFQKTLPMIEFDSYFDTRRLDYLYGKFGLSDEDNKTRSTLYIQSGEIMGNPFFFGRDLVHHMGTKTYTGSLVITYTTTTYVDGRRVTQTHTQTLYASLEKPHPYYHEIPYVVYGNEAAPDLSFDRTDSDAEKMSEKQIERAVTRGAKKLEKKARKEVSKGGDFTMMGNTEFEVLFGAHNRDNEVQFRMLFTPLAQRQLLALMKDNKIGYGDNFDFKKRKMINVVYPQHLLQSKFFVNPTAFHGYDVDAIRERFVDYNNTYFKEIYFAFAPLMAIPLYQHHKPQEYIYKDYYSSYASFYEHEHVVNRMNLEAFIHPLSRTRNILKTSVVKSEDRRDYLQVDAYGFTTEEHVDYIPVRGNDGRTHNVPVHWTEYIPVEQRTEVAIDVPEIKEDETPKSARDALLERLQQRGENIEEIKKVGLLLAHLKNELPE